MKKTVSILLTGLMAFSSVAVASTASAVETASVNDQVCKVGGTVSYTYTLKTPGKVEDFQGELDYSSGLKLEEFKLSETVGVLTNDGIEGVVYYTGSSPDIEGQTPYDFTGGVTLVTAKFRVNEAGTQTVQNKMELITGTDGTMYYDYYKNISAEESEKTEVDYYAVDTLTLDKSTASVYTGETTEINADFAPAYATESEITWTSSDETVAAVSAADTKATVTGLKPGTATITAKCGDKTAACEVTVADKSVPVSSVTVSPVKATVSVGKTQQITATVAPAEATDKSLTWTSSNEKVATVSSSGLVKAVAKGTATITATANDGSGASATVEITVVQPVTKITLNKTSQTIKVKQKVTLKANVTPTTASNKAVVWATKNKKVATVTSKGVVTGVAKGTTYITATAKDGSKKSAKCKITVKQLVTNIKLNKTKLTLKVGAKYTLKAKVTPTNANNKKVTWTSKNKKIASVTSKGVVKGVKKGKTTITVKAKDGSKKSAKCTVTVKKK